MFRVPARVFRRALVGSAVLPVLKGMVLGVTDYEDSQIPRQGLRSFGFNAFCLQLLTLSF
jgi:hypothetical protein